jgi:peptidoglycan-N-acetylglucosamine deacetylase
MFKEKGWKLVDADEAFTDNIFQTVSNHAGESLIWAIANESGKFEDQLRYPAEDSKYEKENMDKLGL